MRLELPASVEVTVVEAPDAIGDTAGNVLKPVTTTGGITVQVPLFIKDDVIKISTSDRSYLVGIIHPTFQAQKTSMTMEVFIILIGRLKFSWSNRT